MFNSSKNLMHPVKYVNYLIQAGRISSISGNYSSQIEIEHLSSCVIGDLLVGPGKFRFYEPNYRLTELLFSLNETL